MDPDLFLTAGLILAFLTVPSILSAMSDGRAPRASAVTILIAGAMVLYAATQKPGGYQIDQIPRVVMGVINGILG